jgi:hypothetical protein
MLKGEAKTKYMRDYMRRRRGGQGPAKPKSGPQRVAKTDNASQARIRDLEAELTRERERREAAEAKAAKLAQPGSSPDDLAAKTQEIVGLKERLANERQRLNEICANYEAKLKVRKGAGLWTRGQYRAVVSCLHQDSRDTKTEEQRNAACRIVIASEQFIVLRKDRGK